VIDHAWIGGDLIIYTPKGMDWVEKLRIAEKLETEYAERIERNLLSVGYHCVFLNPGSWTGMTKHGGSYMVRK
jgi:hypothetical protein